MRLAMMLMTALALGGCIVVHDHDGNRGTRHRDLDDDYEVRRPAPVGRVVTVERVHVHNEGCGHHWYNGKWYHHQGHIHGAGCGHAQVEGVWIHAGLVTIKTGHVHSATCGHFSHGGSWYYMHEHHHSAGCGHLQRNGIWIAVKF